MWRRDLVEGQRKEREKRIKMNERKGERILLDLQYMGWDQDLCHCEGGKFHDR